MRRKITGYRHVIAYRTPALQPSAFTADHIVRMGPGEFNGPKTGIVKRHSEYAE
jgi:hypothetical protein